MKIKTKKTFGIYRNFPSMCHGIAHFNFSIPLSDLQRAIFKSLYNLNNPGGDYNLPGSVESGLKVIFEFGVADGMIFNYIDEETLDISIRNINEEVFRILDFFCVIRYYNFKNDLRRALRFDYYILRFIFGNGEFETQIFHEKGLQRVSIGDLVAILTRNINLELMGKNLNPIKMNYLRVI